MKKLLAFSLPLILLLAITCGCSASDSVTDEPIESDISQEDTTQPDTPLADDPSQTDTPPEEPEIVPYGTCGEKLNWELSDDGVLTISGTGTMEYNAQPWAHYTESIVSVVIENGVTSIGDDAFAGCTNLASIALPESMMFIGGRAFSGCCALTGLKLPGSVKSIGDGAFKGCSALSDVSFGGNDWTWSKVKVGADNECLLTMITLVTAEGTCGNELTWRLTSDGVLTISGTGAMADYELYAQPWYDYRKSITSIVINGDVTTIGALAFWGCSNLANIVIPNSVTSIGDTSFGNCSALTSITIPDSVTSIDIYAFCNCTGLTSITIPDNVTSIGLCAFLNCAGLTSITIGNGVTTIESSVFQDCTSITSITIGGSITTINGAAFYGCTNLTSVTIGTSVTTIIGGAFNNCPALSTVCFCGTQEQWNAIAIFEYGNDSLLNAEIVFS